MKKGHLISKKTSLPNLTIADLYNPKIDTLTKKINKDFLLHDTKKVAFLCLTPQILNIDGKLEPCSHQALTFDKQPLKMTLNGTIVWDNLKNQPGNHLAKQIRWAFSDLKPKYTHNNLFSQNILSQHALDKI